MPKPGRNDKCPCGSNKKYKLCCINKPSDEDLKYLNGHEISSENLIKVSEKLKEDYPDFKVIDVTNFIEESNYRQFQTKNFYDKTLMILEKNDKNKQMFKKRVPDNDKLDIMVLYHGAYTSFVLTDMEEAWFKIKKMIDVGFQ